MWHVTYRLLASRTEVFPARGTVHETGRREGRTPSSTGCMGKLKRYATTRWYRRCARCTSINQTHRFTASFRTPRSISVFLHLWIQRKRESRKKNKEHIQQNSNRKSKQRKMENIFVML